MQNFSVPEETIDFYLKKFHILYLIQKPFVNENFSTDYKEFFFRLQTTTSAWQIQAEIQFSAPCGED